MELQIQAFWTTISLLILLVVPAVVSSGRVCDSGAVPCSNSCCCEEKSFKSRRGHLTGILADCAHQNLASVPAQLPADTLEIDLSLNNISSLPADAFGHVPSLHLLKLEGNHLSLLGKDVFRGLTQLEILNLGTNRFQQFPSTAFHADLYNLRVLHLEGNWLSDVPDGSFINLPSLSHLNLEMNRLNNLPVRAIQPLGNLQILNLNNNEIRAVPDFAFEKNSNLKELLLTNNMIERIGANTFTGLQQLEYLLFKLNPITSIDHTAFRNFPQLIYLEISDVKNLSVFPDLTGTNNLEELAIDRCSLRNVPEKFCQNRTALKHLKLHNNQISVLPNLTSCFMLQSVNLGYNRLTTLEGQPFYGLRKLYDLHLHYNNIKAIPADAFTGLSNLNTLVLSNNDITQIDSQAFVPCLQLENLNLNSNSFPILPSSGLQKLIKIQTHDNEKLNDFPPPSELPMIHSIETSYPYHCCEYIELMKEYEGSFVVPNISEETTWNSNLDYEYGANQTWHSSWSNFDYISFLGSPSWLMDGSPQPYLPLPRNITCQPRPGPFLPCVDLFGSWPLRIGVWFIFLLAIVGNAIVIFVILVSHTKIDVPRFLICNLAFADFFLGIYLSFLAGVDTSTHGDFRKRGIAWQLSTGCKLAGFLAVFSSELSIYTLSVITLERFYAIKHALHLEKRMKLPHAITVMGFGWLFAIVCAMLPLVNVSHYHKFPVCLPFDVETTIAKVYVGSVLVLNMLAFVIIMSCYANIYFAIQGSHAWNCNDSRVARRMSLLVFTDFACWAPITFFSLTSAFGLRLISLDGAKVLTIFVLPLNSCANPFLYTILTKQFKKDCRTILRNLSIRVFRQRSMSRSFTLSLGRHPSMRSTQAHQTSQLRWRTNGSISQDVTGDPSLISFKSSSNVYTVANYSTADPHTTQTTDINSSCYANHSQSDSSTMLDPMANNSTLDDPRRGSRSPLLDLINQVKSKGQDSKPKPKIRRKFSIPIPFFSSRSPSKSTPEGSSSQHSSKSSPTGQRHKRSYSVTEGLLHKMGRKKPLASVESAPGKATALSGSAERLNRAGNGHIGAVQIIIPQITHSDDQVVESQQEGRQENQQEVKAIVDPWQVSSPLFETHKDPDSTECLLETAGSPEQPSPSKHSSSDDNEAERLLASAHENPVRDQLSSATPSPLLHRPEDLNLDAAPVPTTDNPNCDSGLGTASSPFPESAAEYVKFLPSTTCKPNYSKETRPKYFKQHSPKPVRQMPDFGGMLVQITKSDQSKCYNEVPNSPSKASSSSRPKESVV